MKTRAEITELLIEVQKGSKQAYEELFPLVYNELKRIAFSKLQSERKDITITETELVHEVYLKMIDQTKIKATDKNHFIDSSVSVPESAQETNSIVISITSAGIARRITL